MFDARFILPALLALLARRWVIGSFRGTEARVARRSWEAIRREIQAESGFVMTFSLEHAFIGTGIDLVLCNQKMSKEPLDSLLSSLNNGSFDARAWPGQLGQLYLQLLACVFSPVLRVTEWDWPSTCLAFSQHGSELVVQERAL